GEPYISIGRVGTINSSPLRDLYQDHLAATDAHKSTRIHKFRNRTIIKGWYHGLVFVAILWISQWRNIIGITIFPSNYFLTKVDIKE
ncbi:MAG: hypothetical protein R3182_03650, partial [Draconibacterium sp.]|nr:hypothetical protein [Draconibacterium sp.]